MEVSTIFKSKLTQVSTLLVLAISLYSCGTYQSVYNSDNDGIYASNTHTRQYNDNVEVEVVDQQTFDQNYFSNKLNEIDQIGDEDIITDIDEYYYDDTEEQNNNDYGPWEYTNDVTINVNSGYGYYGGFNDYSYYNPFYHPYHNYYPYYSSFYNNPWR